MSFSMNLQKHRVFHVLTLNTQISVRIFPYRFLYISWGAGKESLFKN